MKPAVSIIVPVYNVASYLPRCLDSLIGQTLSDIEIILVDDGSTDRSAEILSRYAGMDGRIKVIRQANQGQGGARNAGLDVAAGTYVGFVDADDWAEPGMFETLYQRALETGADLCACDYNTVYDRRVVPNALGLTDETVHIAARGIDRYWLDKKFSVVLWNKLYKRSVIRDHAIRFDAHGEVFSEDVLFNLFYLLHTRIVAAVPMALYNYYQRQGSLTHSFKPDYLQKELTLVEKFRTYYAAYEDQAKTENMMAGLLFDRVLDNSLHNLECRTGLRRLRRDLKLASRHPFFFECMRRIAGDSGTWLPLRGFALLNSRGLFLLSACYLKAYRAASRVKKRVDGSGIPA
ncbi:glycosyltransferase [Cohnella sp. JJ-181]|uniref:glycosyltransferase n=1 Tax=Cohnella rhizoplanae TaxID=2974897 RepID=UPI0022FFB397|nr:glycosyltransferase [Cohnella sp. JJ-181]CAI6082817.1 Undecaprenyl-phosphate 4-deoxy-4-formamido-L-arabinose transferase [Cohnella sp. JJ-181]